MKYVILYSIFVIALVSCNNNKPTIPFLTPSNLSSTFISIRSDSAYNLITPKGAFIKINKNSFDVPANTPVKIELKEAYSMKDIVLAGLTTKSNGKLLQSGGMIFFNATANGNNVKIIKPISIGIPTTNYKDSMKLFKGEIKPDSSINWTNPSPLDTTAIDNERFLTGRAIFRANCANCHKPSEDFTGPPLKGARKREPNPNWAYKWIDNVNIMVTTDPYAIALHRKFGSIMTQQNLTNAEIKTVLDYCDNAPLSDDNISIKTDSTIVEYGEAQATDFTDDYNDDSIIAPCGFDTTYLSTANNNTPPVINNQTPVSPNTNSSVSYPVPPPTIYQFNISQGGWYNIDCFISANNDAVTPVILSATVNSVAPDSIQVYLCIPKRTLMANGTFNDEKNYGFYYGSDTVQLILNDEAMIIALGRINNKIYYGFTKFIVKENQSVPVTIKESSTDIINQSIHDNALDSVQFDKTADQPVPATTATINTPAYVRYEKAKDGRKIELIPKKCNGNINN